MIRGSQTGYLETGMALKTVRAFETGRTKPLGITRAAFKQALEKAGVEFLDGVRLAHVPAV
jgi:hypothetical protein